MTVTNDDGKTQCRLVRRQHPHCPKREQPARRQTGVDHIVYTLANWDTDKAVKPAVEPS